MSPSEIINQVINDSMFNFRERSTLELPITDFELAESGPIALNIGPAYATFLTYKENYLKIHQLKLNPNRIYTYKSSSTLAIQKNSSIVTLYYKANALEYSKHLPILQKMIDSKSTDSKRLSIDAPIGLSLLGNIADFPIISSMGKNVSHSWFANDRLLYSRSTDGGETFEPTISFGNDIGYLPLAISVSENNVYLAWTCSENCCLQEVQTVEKPLNQL